jgi:hypothetical protein
MRRCLCGRTLWRPRAAICLHCALIVKRAKDRARKSAAYIEAKFAKVEAA